MSLKLLQQCHMKIAKLSVVLSQGKFPQMHMVITAAHVISYFFTRKPLQYPSLVITTNALMLHYSEEYNYCYATELHNVYAMVVMPLAL